METRAPHWFAFIAFVMVVFAAVAGIWQKVMIERWRRKEFIDDLIRAFEEDPMVGHALALLNWNGRLAKFHPAHAEHRERFPNVTIAKLARALESEDENVMKDFDPVDQAIRDCFDGFLGHLERFNRLIETRRLRHEEIFHHLCEWIELIGRNDGTHQPPGSQVIDKLWKYIDAKGYRHTQRLFEKFGYTIKPR